MKTTIYCCFLSLRYADDLSHMEIQPRRRHSSNCLLMTTPLNAVFDEVQVEIHPKQAPVTPAITKDVTHYSEPSCPEYEPNGPLGQECIEIGIVTMNLPIRDGEKTAHGVKGFLGVQHAQNSRTEPIFSALRQRVEKITTERKGLFCPIKH